MHVVKVKPEWPHNNIAFLEGIVLGMKAAHPGYLDVRRVGNCLYILYGIHKDEAVDGLRAQLDAKHVIYEISSQGQGETFIPF